MAYTQEIISDASGTSRVTSAAVVSTVTLEAGKMKVSDSHILSGKKSLGDRGPVFSADGATVLFSGWGRNFQGSIWSYDLASRQLVRLEQAGDARYPQWSSDSDSILFERRQGNGTEPHLVEMAGITPVSPAGQ
ncbi:MAG: TolB family protein [Desulfopila sp.]